MLRRSLKSSTRPMSGFICLSCLVAEVGLRAHALPSFRRSLTTAHVNSEPTNPSVIVNIKYPPPTQGSGTISVSGAPRVRSQPSVPYIFPHSPLNKHRAYFPLAHLSLRTKIRLWDANIKLALKATPGSGKKPKKKAHKPKKAGKVDNVKEQANANPSLGRHLDSKTAVKPRKKKAVHAPAKPQPRTSPNRPRKDRPVSLS